jgi:hypothetical protein
MGNKIGTNRRFHPHAPGDTLGNVVGTTLRAKSGGAFGAGGCGLYSTAN